MLQNTFKIETTRRDVVEAMLQFCPVMNKKNAYEGADSEFLELMREPSLDTAIDFVAACDARNDISIDRSAPHQAVLMHAECTFAIRLAPDSTPRRRSWIVIVANCEPDYARSLMQIIHDCAGCECELTLAERPTEKIPVRTALNHMTASVAA